MISLQRKNKDKVKVADNKEKNIFLLLQGQKGFTLIEILVALFIVAIIITSFTMSGSIFDPHRELVSSLDSIERAIRFSSDETVLRNRIVRIVLDAESEPNSLTVEYGPNKNFLLPNDLFADYLSEEEFENKRKEVEKQFSKVLEFQDSPLEFDSDIRVIAVGTNFGGLKEGTLFQETKSSLFFYPSGERDAAIIIISNNREIATLTIEPFTLDFKRKFYTIEEDEIINDDFFNAKSRELYKDWMSWEN